MRKVSVIIPVFNPGEGIKKCIKSLQDQTLQDIEMIFVDDCGTDDALKVIEEAAEQDCRIKILRNKENIGAGPSRNRGIEAASGKYLGFIDPDDYINADYYELLYKAALKSNADIAKGKRVYVNTDGKIISLNEADNLNDRIIRGCKEGKPLYSLFTFEHTTAIYRRDLVISSDARYGTSRNDQDTTFLLQICFAANRIVFEKGAVYYYVAREGSAVRSFTANRLEQAIVALKEKMDFLLPRYSANEGFYQYVIHLILTRLQMAAKIMATPGSANEVIELQDSLRKYVLSFTFYSKLCEMNFLVKAFLEYSTNLTIDPYGRQWKIPPFQEYKAIIIRWVKFLQKYPEYAWVNKGSLMYMFENAITYNGWISSFEREENLKEIRVLANRLPDKNVLTKDFIAMKLFVDYGINLFGLRRSVVGSMVRYILSKIREFKNYDKNE